MLQLDVLAWVFANIFCTLIIFKFSVKLFQLSNQFALLHPLIISSGVIMLLLYALNISFESYQEHSEVITYMLSLATVALGVPLYKNLRLLFQYKYSILTPLLLGAIISPASAIFILWLFNVEHNLLLSMVSKSITSPIAIKITEVIGGIPSIAVIFVILSGLIGAAVAEVLFDKLSIKSDISKGLALGIASHAIGTSRAFQISETCAAFSVLAMCLNGIITTSIIVFWLQW